jgi:hypothetical protein
MQKRDERDGRAKEHLKQKFAALTDTMCYF